MEEPAMHQISLLATKRSLLIQMSAALMGAATSLPKASVGQVPGRAITIIVPQTPGTGPDILARTIGAELQQKLGQPVIVENIPGASGNIGTEVAARSIADGHTLLMHTTPLVTNAGLFKSLRYDPLKSFTPIVEVAVGYFALFVHPSIPAMSTAEFIEYVRARPGQLNYGSPGYGTPHHLAMELFKHKTGVNLVHIPYKGSAGAVADLIGGHIAVMVLPLHVGWTLAKDQKIRALAVASSKRVSFVPELPTLAEQDIPGVDMDGWYGLFAPAGTPAAIIARFNSEVNEILRSPRIAETLAKQGLTIVGGTPDEFGILVARDLAFWLTTEREVGIAME
jgi:tripartite-type tricarboxylate transporter receptor subunit TctC